MTNEKAGQEKEVTPKGAVEVNEEQLDDAAGGAIYGEGKSVKIDFVKTDRTVDPTDSDATFSEKPA